ncbi:hypothetical protein [Candidatus Harpocratesius sp.]
MPGKTETRNEFDWDGVVTQIHDIIGSNTAIFNKYGIILASKISQFEKGSLISPTILDFIDRKQNLIRELQVQNIECIVLEGDKENIVFTFGENYNLMSNIPKNVDLAKYMPSITSFLRTLHKTAPSNVHQTSFKLLSLEDEFEEMKNSTEEQVGKERFPIFKHLIKYLAKK